MISPLQKFYCDISSAYELVNHAMTLGLDVVWRRNAARMASATGGARWLDVCTGTGEMAVYLKRAAGQEATVLAADFSAAMLKMATSKREASGIAFILADAQHLPFADGTFDLVTTSYSTRNMDSSRGGLVKSFAEFHRILRPGGHYVSLETSQPPSRPIRCLFHLYVRLTVRPLGYIIARSSAAYTYLSQTIRSFYTAEELAAILRRAGFARVSFRRMMLGAAAIHTAVK